MSAGAGRDGAKCGGGGGSKGGEDDDETALPLSLSPLFSLLLPARSPALVTRTQPNNRADPSSPKPTHSLRWLSRSRLPPPPWPSAPRAVRFWSQRERGRALSPPAPLLRLSWAQPTRSGVASTSRRALISARRARPVAREREACATSTLPLALSNSSPSLSSLSPPPSKTKTHNSRGRPPGRRPQGRRRRPRQVRDELVLQA